jgi:hypothetical protein
MKKSKEEKIYWSNVRITIAILFIVLSIAAFFISGVIYYLWNWLDAFMNWGLGLRFWIPFLTLEIIAIIGLIYFLLFNKKNQSSSKLYDHELDCENIAYYHGEAYFDNSDNYDDY